MRMSGREFIGWEQKSLTLLGMSGVGKTRLACMLRKYHWFHYSGDYRIGTRYLDEAILDNIKQKLMYIPFVRELLRSDSLQLRNNISVDNLQLVSAFLGKLGNPEQGGLSLKEFKCRQALHRQAEIAAMKDVPTFISKAHGVYGYDHFVNDAGGSLCDLAEPEVLTALADSTLIIYIEASASDEQELMRRAKDVPKPLYYQEAFLEKQLSEYMSVRNLTYVALISPDDFVRWIFPRLFYSRIPVYQGIAKKYGYVITAEEAGTVKNEDDFLRLIAEALDR